MVLRKKYPQGIIFKGDFKQSVRKKKCNTFEHQGICSGKSVKVELFFEFQG